MWTNKSLLVFIKTHLFPQKKEKDGERKRGKEEEGEKGVGEKKREEKKKEMSFLFFSLSLSPLCKGKESPRHHTPSYTAFAAQSLLFPLSFRVLFTSVYDWDFGLMLMMCM